MTAELGLTIGPAERELLELDLKLNAQGLAVVVAKQLTHP